MEGSKSENKDFWWFFLFTFAFSWIFWILDALAFNNLISLSLPFVFTSLLAAFGPTLAAIVLTIIYAGRTFNNSNIYPVRRLGP